MVPQFVVNSPTYTSPLGANASPRIEDNKSSSLSWVLYKSGMIERNQTTVCDVIVNTSR